MIKKIATGFIKCGKCGSTFTGENLTKEEASELAISFSQALQECPLYKLQKKLEDIKDSKRSEIGGNHVTLVTPCCREDKWTRIFKHGASTRFIKCGTCGSTFTGDDLILISSKSGAEIVHK